MTFITVSIKMHLNNMECICFAYGIFVVSYTYCQESTELSPVCPGILANNWRKSYWQRADFPIQTSHGTSMGYPILLLRIFDFIAATQITIISILHSLASSSSEDWSRSWNSFFTFPNCICERNRADFFKIVEYILFLFLSYVLWFLTKSTNMHIIWPVSFQIFSSRKQRNCRNPLAMMTLASIQPCTWSSSSVVGAPSGRHSRLVASVLSLFMCDL